MRQPATSDRTGQQTDTARRNARIRTLLLSAIILSYNAAGHLERAVGSLASACAALAPAECEIFVVDNGSRDGSLALLDRLAKAFPGLLHAIRLPQNRGTTVSRNLALRQARGDIVLVMDCDVEVPAGALAPLLGRLGQDPRIGLLAPRLVHRDGRPQLSADVFPTLPHKLRRAFGLRRMERALPAMPETLRRVDYAISAFWMIPRRTLDRVGLLDEKIFYAPEDVDYCLRIWQAGLEVVQDGSVTVIHDAQERSRGWRSPGFALSHVAGLVYFFRKHRYVLGRHRLYRRLGMHAHDD